MLFMAVGGSNAICRHRAQEIKVDIWRADEGNAPEMLVSFRSSTPLPHTWTPLQVAQ